MGSVLVGLLFSMLVAAAVVVAVALPHVRQGARLLTPEGERMARDGVARLRGAAQDVRGRVAGSGRVTAAPGAATVPGARPVNPDRSGGVRHATHTPPWGVQSPRTVDLTGDGADERSAAERSGGFPVRDPARSFPSSH